MIRYKDIESFSAINPVVTIGIFDGVHIGHRYILNKLTQAAQRYHGESVLVTFWPHPRAVLNNRSSDFMLLNSMEEKAAMLESAGLDHLVEIPFTKSFSQLSVNEFVKDILVEKLGIRCLLLGYNQKLGRDREGNYLKIKELAVEHGFGIEKLSPVDMKTGQISSSRIREFLLEGKVEEANRLLGSYYSFSGMVIGGSKLGTSIGFPTANIIPDTDYKLLPADGVYAVRVVLKGNSWMGMMNIGSRPTVNKDPEKKTMEVHLLDFNENIYSEQIRVQFVSRLRDERKFSDIDALKNQLLADRERTLVILSNTAEDYSM